MQKLYFSDCSSYYPKCVILKGIKQFCLILIIFNYIVRQLKYILVIQIYWVLSYVLIYYFSQEYGSRGLLIKVTF